jgi:hypothetical protein
MSRIDFFLDKTNERKNKNKSGLQLQLASNLNIGYCGQTHLFSFLHIKNKNKITYMQLYIRLFYVYLENIRVALVDLAG